MQIIRRLRLGNDTEDITLFQAPLVGSTVAVMDGYDVLGLSPAPVVSPTTPIPNLPVKEGALAVQTVRTAVVRQMPKLFDILGLKVKAGPRGIAYVASQSLFVFNDPTQPATLFLSDTTGQQQRTISIQYPNGEMPQFVEGLAYIPRTSRQFPDHLVMVTTFPDPDNGIQSRLSIINLRGGVVRQIVPQNGIANIFLTGVCFKAPGSLLVSSDDDQVIYELDFDGQQLASLGDRGVRFPTPTPTPPPVLHGIEGLVQTADGNIAAAGGLDGILVIYDSIRGLSPVQVIDYRIGVGLSLPTGLAWDSTANAFLIISFDRQQLDANQFISTLAPSLTKFASLVGVDNLTRKLTFLPDEQLIAATHTNNPRGILLFDRAGQSAGQISTTQFGIPQVISYIPQTNEFVLVFRDNQDPSKNSKLFVLTRQGALSRIIDLAPIGVRRITAAAFFNPQHPSGGQFFVVDPTQNTAIITDFNGAKLDQFSIRDTFGLLTPSAVTAITSGTDDGALAIVNSETSEVVVFRL
ncbi:MAG: hypothetical protein ICV60_19810 [Pyrinomonadaceae bacterium]|nr:hypothetical protein [Pyrinomonadaceae bacterium]